MLLLGIDLLQLREIIDELILEFFSAATPIVFGKAVDLKLAVQVMDLAPLGLNFIHEVVYFLD